MMGTTKESDGSIGRRLRLRDLHLLSTVVQWGSMAKAAAHLGISQPSISEAIVNFEGLLGVRLLDRSPRGVEPTIYATALLKRGRLVFDELRQGLRDIEFLADPRAGQVRVGCPESLADGFLPAVIDRLVRQWPQVVVNVLSVEPAAHKFRELRDREVDLMIGRLLAPVDDNDFSTEVLFEDGFFVVAGCRSKWARRRKIALKELIDEPWIHFPQGNVVRTYLERVIQAQGLEFPRESVSTFSMHVRRRLLATGRYVTLMAGSMPRYAEARSFRVLPVDLRIQPHPVAIVTLRNRTQSAVAQVFIEHARAEAKSMSRSRSRGLD